MGPSTCGLFLSDRNWLAFWSDVVHQRHWALGGWCWVLCGQLGFITDSGLNDFYASIRGPFFTISDVLGFLFLVTVTRTYVFLVGCSSFNACVFILGTFLFQNT